jgi:CubicO group peptidase (beta-lactamase class C family)
METDGNNDYLSSGQCWSTARDLGRLGLLYLADGRWNGERLLPADWPNYVATAAPGQSDRAATALRYGAQFWIYGGRNGLPADAYSAVGARGQYVMIVPSENLVVVRRGFDSEKSFNISQFTADVIKALRD